MRQGRWNSQLPREMRLEGSFFQPFEKNFVCPAAGAEVQRLKSENPALRLPPGPRKLPLIGNMHQLVGSLPHHSLTNLAKKHGSLIHLKTGAVSNIVISSPELAKEALKTNDIIFASRSCLLVSKIMSYDSTNIVFSPYGNYWRQDMFSAGSETSLITVEWTLAEMLKNTRIMEKATNEVRQVFDGRGNVDEAGIHEPKFLKAVIKETLRLHPAVPLILRECRNNCKLNGYDIPIKSKVLVNAGAIGRDPNYWNDAETFYPERFLESSIDLKGTDFKYIPFGAGRRICPGISFALSNIELPIAQLLYHFDWKLPHGMKPEELDMTEALGLSIRRRHELFAIPIPYHPLPVN
ncbi:Cytochrome P450, putative [Theobroma cacao]|uniref:Cytochrome P450, putative n=1 Tax=Theobroma cacao TaxID=3641 RepID=A0A061EJA8_THECC|nr:Cytochrome P450, putative [Theobroma cacao]